MLAQNYAKYTSEVCHEFNTVIKLINQVELLFIGTQNMSVKNSFKYKALTSGMQVCFPPACLHPLTLALLSSHAV